ncbi:RIP metalloprotease RseP [Schauerella aestuarii]|uniref:RIP metalloprotease RseP n=1 Tax=Schauerella aestuarii TaxID=2511204 RepID=UPI0013682F60|nr:RIP metalloprotease RseP [Achromobacter aestuarii]MYZ44848.1 RIP metalloprotease RseP [Achromobacter aestuarii]
MLFTLLAFVVALGVLITFHELGHYSVARWCGVRVLRFSVGFGRVLIKRVDRHGTEWAISVLPLGGYVKMQDDPPPGATAAQRAESFNAQSVGRRFAIVAAGPIFNLVLAVVLYAALSMAGTQEPAAVLGQPAPDTPAAMAGVVRGDRVTAVDGQSMRSWNEVRWALLDRASSGGSARLTVATAGGADRERILNISAQQLDPSLGDPLLVAGLSLAMPAPVVRNVIAGGAGERAGLKDGDVILAAGGRGDLDSRVLVNIIQQHPEQALPLSVRRAGQTLTVDVVPAAETVEGKRIGRLNVQLGGDLDMVEVRYGPWESLTRGVTRTADTAWFSLKMMGRMVTGDVSWRNISGPVTIADYAGQTARLGWAAYIAYLALISISLGVLNLLPIPMLDGGHLLYYLIEIVRGSPPPERWLDIGQRAGLGLLAALMGLALFNDLSRLFA